MAALGRKLRTLEGGRLAFWCPGCDQAHQIAVRRDVANMEGPAWFWDGNPDAPTFSPSILVRTGHFTDKHQKDQCWCNCDDPDPGFRCSQCHSYVTQGRILFLADCSHALAGQTVDLPDWPLGEG
jgi:hypothetical protein